MEKHKKILNSTAKSFLGTLNDYFGTDDKETALWFYCGLGFTILCGTITLLVSVVLP